MNQSGDVRGMFFFPLSLSLSLASKFACEKDLKSFWQFQAFDLLLLFFSTAERMWKSDIIHNIRVWLQQFDCTTVTRLILYADVPTV